MRVINLLTLSILSSRTWARDKDRSAHSTSRFGYGEHDLDHDFNEQFGSNLREGDGMNYSHREDNYFALMKRAKKPAGGGSPPAAKPAKPSAGGPNQQSKGKSGGSPRASKLPPFLNPSSGQQSSGKSSGSSSAAQRSGRTSSSNSVGSGSKRKQSGSSSSSGKKARLSADSSPARSGSASRLASRPSTSNRRPSSKSPTPEATRLTLELTQHKERQRANASTTKAFAASFKQGKQALKADKAYDNLGSDNYYSQPGAMAHDTLRAKVNWHEGLEKHWRKEKEGHKADARDSNGVVKNLQQSGVREI